MKREIYRGIEEQELKSMSLDQFAKLLNSRERRALKRIGNNIEFKKLISKAEAVRTKNPNRIIKTHVREAVILPSWIGLTFGVYNGKAFKNITITIEKIGKRLGDFSHTSGRVLHAGPGIGATRGSKFVAMK